MPEPEDTDLFFILLERIADALESIDERLERIGDESVTANEAIADLKNGH